MSDRGLATTNFTKATVAELVLKQAGVTPDAIAVMSATGRVTYDELARDTERWACLLVQREVPPASRVGVALSRNCLLPAALLGVWRAGSAYVPLDIGYPRAWLAEVASDAGIGCIIVDNTTRPLIEEVVQSLDKRSEILLLDASELEPDAAPSGHSVDTSALAYLIYTSGTTGKPKGVKILQRNAANFINWARREFGATELSSVLATTSICFDLSVFELFTPLTVGGRVILAEDPLAIADDPPCGAPSLINTVPSAMRELLRLGALPETVQSVNLAGEPLPPDLLAAIWARPHVRRVRNLYGPSETTTYSTCAVLARGQAKPSIGRPIANTEVKVLRPDGRLAAVGEPGEILIGGAGVADGYWQRPELSAKKFLPAAIGSEWPLVYRTGDLGAWQPDGTLAFYGRIDRQLKIRGVRVEPEEIEICLRKLPGVRDAAVIGIEFRGDLSLAAFLVGEESARAMGVDELRRRLGADLPSSMVPSFWHWLDELPRLANGKMDRERLGAFMAAEPRRNNDSRPAPLLEAEKNALTEIVAREMAAVLGCDAIASDASFVSLGGNSLAAVRLVARLRRRLGRKLPTSAPMRADTPAALAELVASSPTFFEEGDTLLDTGSPAAALTESQRRLWLYQRLYPESSAHHFGLLLRWRLPCDPEDLVQRCMRLALRHFPLGARGIDDQGRWLASDASVPVTIEAVNDLDDGHLRSLVSQEFRREFNLAAAPPWRGRIFDRDGYFPWLVLSFHQVAIDGETIALFLQDLCVDPAEVPKCKGGARSLACLPSDPVIDPAADAYWRNLFSVPLADPFLADLGLPLDEHRAQLQRARRRLSPALQRRIDAWSKRHGSTPYRVMLATFVRALHLWAGKTEFLIGSAFSLRDLLPEAENMPGFVARALPLRIKVEPCKPIAALVERVHQSVSDAHDNRSCTPEHLQKFLESACPALTASPLPISFGMLPEVAGLVPCEGNGPFDAEELFAPDVEGQLRVQVRWPATMDKPSSDAGGELVLDARTAAPEAIAQLADDWIQVLEALDGDTTGAIEPELVYRAFAVRARELPEKVALVTGDGRSLSYRELHDEVLAIARMLGGGEGGSPCGLMFSDQLPAIAAAFACLRQARAFLPLRHGESATRIKAIIARFGIDMVLSDGTHHLRRWPDGPSILDTGEALPGPLPPERCGTPRSPAYVLLTSGSTGRPKGVAQSQANLMHHMRRYADSISLSPRDRVALLTTLHFDAGLMDIFATLTVGATLYVWPLAQRGFLGLDAWLEENEITVLHCTPSVFRQIVRTGDIQPHKLGAIRFVVLGGEPARTDDLRLFQQHFSPGTVLINGFGPTECTTAIQARFDHNSKVAGAMLPIGQPLPGTEAALLDEEGRPGAPVGEIALSDEHLFLGYVSSGGDLERLSLRGRVRWHRTGDIARRTPEGALVHLARRDELAKIDGVRVAPIEIELAVLDQMSEIGSAAAIVVPLGAAMGVHLFVTARSGARVEAREIMAQLTQALPANQLPNSVDVLGRLPFLSNGKVNRRALKRLFLRRKPDRADRAVPDLDPAPDWELHLRETVSRVLGLAVLPQPEDRFPALGGRSLQALVVIDRMRALHSVRLAPRALLSGMTLRQASELIAAEVSGEPRVAPVTQEEMATPSPMQLGFWLAEQAQPGTPANQVLLAMSFGAPINRPSMLLALQRLVERHPQLRTRYQCRGETVRTVRDPPAAPDLGAATCAVLPEAINASQLDPEFTRGFDLETEWPFRAMTLADAAGRDLLILNFHHICVDAFSIDIILRDVETYYRDRRSAGLTEQRAAPEHAVVDFEAAKCRLARELRPALADRQLAFWRRQLTGKPREFRLSATAGRPSQSAHRAARALQGDAAEIFGRFCTERGLARSSVLLCLWAITLSVQASAEELTIGMPVSLRDLPGEAEVVGPLFNMVALPVSIAPKDSFARLTGRIARLFDAALENRHLPLQRLLSELEPGREPDCAPLYQATFSWHDYGNAGTAFAHRLPAFNGGISGEIALTVEDGADPMLFVDISKSVAGARRARLILDQLLHLIGLLCSAPDIPLGEIDLLPPSQRARVLGQLGAGAERETGTQGLFDRVAGAVGSSKRPALAGPWGELSYKDLIGRAEGLAVKLRDIDVAPGDVISVEIGAEGTGPVIAALAAWRLNAVYFPIDPCAPEPLRQMAIREAGSRVLIRRDMSIRSLASVDPPRQIPAGVAYAMQTSGTTGRPKVVAGTTSGLINRLEWMTDQFCSGGDAPTTLQTTSALFDSSLWQFFWPLVQGGTCVIPDRACLLDADELTRIVEAVGVDVMDLVPSVAASLVPELEASAMARQRLECLSWLILGGETLSPALARRLRSVLPETRIINLYGPTEASIGCISYELGNVFGNTVPIGRPIFNSRAAVLDLSGRPVPEGSFGELWLLGVCVGAGYLTENGLSRFSDCPVPELGDIAAYPTGDTVRWNETGNLEFFGRSDSQVKLRGFRVELGAVEEAAAEVPGVARAVALLGSDSDGVGLGGATRLDLFVQRGPAGAVDAARIRAGIESRLPRSHWPDTIRLVESLPVTAAGKVDRQALCRIPAPVRNTGSDDAVASDDDLQRQIRQAWASLLPEGGPDLLPDISFFEAGGHSFLLLRLRHELGRIFGKEPTITQLFRNPTIRKQADLLASAMSVARPGESAEGGNRD
ncbi:non-ribosomal peptide synthetase [Roseibium album]|uniref:non-ribosomal peptide synthetase n=1 Tax=Roseibium album TaxID=311410 RepID=UPI002493CF44|nr:non-ribosomal peptide synthetase [Roseibium album]